MSLADEIMLLLIFVLQIAIYVSNINHLNNVLFKDIISFKRYPDTQTYFLIMIRNHFKYSSV